MYDTPGGTAELNSRPAWLAFSDAWKQSHDVPLLMCLLGAGAMLLPSALTQAGISMHATPNTTGQAAVHKF